MHVSRFCVEGIQDLSAVRKTGYIENGQIYM